MPPGKGYVLSCVRQFRCLLSAAGSAPAAFSFASVFSFHHCVSHPLLSLRLTWWSLLSKEKNFCQLVRFEFYFRRRDRKQSRPFLRSHDPAFD
jgi:hypothetical protein